MPVATLEWRDGGLDIIDQRLLPQSETHILLSTVEDVAEAIETLAVRGAPAIGCAAAYGVVIAAMENTDIGFVREAMARLRRTRPTAVNLFYALDRMESVVDTAFAGSNPVASLLDVARDIHDTDNRICRELSLHGAELLHDGDTVLTHCNAGGLATGGMGTALGIIYAAVEAGKRITVFADETRPLLQGARLTTWELGKAGVPVTLICDNMAASVMASGQIDHVIVGADRIAANGDTANKIGTYGVALSARYHDIPFMVAAPLTSFDFTLETGGDIPIEERDHSEITELFGARIAPEGIMVYNPAFDVTPASLITEIVSERGVAQQPFTSSLASWRTD
jgi:methylthioribose-1-phosphate isomerase